MFRPLCLFSAVCLLAVGCGPQDTAPAPEQALVLEADVERFRTDVFLETTEIDAAIAQFEGEAVGTDSLTALAYDDALGRLRDARRRLQVRVDSLRPMPAAAFDTTRQAIEAQTEELREALDRARFDVALTGEALQARARREVARLDDVFAALRADTTRAAEVRLDSLTALRGRLNEGLDTLRRVPPERVDAVRLRVVEAVGALRAAAEAARPDTVQADAPQAGP